MGSVVTIGRPTLLLLRYIYGRGSVTVTCDKLSDGSSRLSIPLPVVEGCTEEEKEW